MCLRELGIMGLLSPGGMLLWVTRRLYVVMVFLAPFVPFTLGMSGFP